MSLESSTTIAGLVAANPASSDPESQGYQHFQLIKNVLKKQFPGVAGQGYAIPITTTEAELNFVHNVTSAIQTQLNTLTASVNALTATILAGAVPSGMIAQWSGAIGTIPTGWKLCNGTNGTPDLRDRFVIGAGGSYGVGGAGGSANAVVVSHNHAAVSVSTSAFTGSILAPHTHTDSGHTHPNSAVSFHGFQVNPVNQGAVPGTTGIGNAVISSNSAGTPAGSVTTNTTTTNTAAGVSGTGANIPPYYALAYIMKS